jgi:hypothetical protein
MFAKAALRRRPERSAAYFVHHASAMNSTIAMKA